MTADDANGLGWFPATARAALVAALGVGPVIEAAPAQTICESLGLTRAQLMIALLPAAAAHAITPLSGFHVGAIALGSTTGNLYLGSNMEFPPHALSFSVHGEQSAMNNAWLHGEHGIAAVAVNEVPCRQFLIELSTSDELEILMPTASTGSDNHPHSTERLSHYLHDAFGPRDLGITTRLMSPVENGLTLDPSVTDVADPLVAAALDAANSSYAPYTGDVAGVAIRTAAGTTYRGRYGENAAFNPSISPLQSALASLNMHEPPQAAYEIEAAVLVEAASGSISRLSVTEALLDSIAPGVELTHLLA